MIIQKKVQTIINNASIKYKLPVELIEHIYISEFEFVKRIMKEGKYETIQLPGLGKFFPSIRKLQYIKKNFKNIRNESEIDRKIKQSISEQ